MQTVMLFAAKALTVAKGAAAAVGKTAVAAGKTMAGSTGATAAATGGGGSAVAAAAGGAGKTASSLLNAIRVGTSVVSTLSTFAMGATQAQAMEREAFDEEMAARQEHIQAVQRSNLIEEQYNKTIGDQLAIASASGVDLGSGSVIEARRQARADADREVDITRNGAAMNAALRRARAASLRANAKSTRMASAGQGAVQAGNAVVDWKKVG